MWKCGSSNGSSRKSVQAANCPEEPVLQLSNPSFVSSPGRSEAKNMQKKPTHVLSGPWVAPAKVLQQPRRHYFFFVLFGFFVSFFAPCREAAMVHHLPCPKKFTLIDRSLTLSIMTLLQLQRIRKEERRGMKQGAGSGCHRKGGRPGERRCRTKSAAPGAARKTTGRQMPRQDVSKASAAQGCRH